MLAKLGLSANLISQDGFFGDLILMPRFKENINYCTILAPFAAAREALIAIMEINPLITRLKEFESRTETLRGYLEYEVKCDRLEEVSRELEDPDVWSKPEYAQKLGRERSEIETIVKSIDELTEGVTDCRDLLELAVEENDLDTVTEVEKEIDRLGQVLDKLEFRRMFSGEADGNNAFLDIQSGSGGTEAQDWANMMLRMFLRWGESRGFKTELVEVSDGDVAGIKSATIRFEGAYAFGWLRTETGVHRLVRKSPFDSGGRRHTSFASVFVSPEIDDNVEIEINPADLRVDVYRASGAGGQHVNRTESAVRITHEPSGIVVQSQSQRSQHQNRDNCMKQLRSKLYEMEMLKRREAAQEVEDSKADIGWGSQIRSYVLDDQRIKDLRTGVQTSNCDRVLDGELDLFIEASLKAGL